VTKIKQRPIPP